LKHEELLQEVSRLIEPIIQSQGMDLVDVEYQKERQGWVLRVFIDHEDGISVEDCAEVSGELGAVLEIHDFVPSPYVLEVSSPGLNRRLKKEQDFNKYRNRLITLKTWEAVEGRKNFRGVLLGLEGEKVRLEVERRIYEIPFQRISKANLEIEF